MLLSRLLLRSFAFDGGVADTSKPGTIPVGESAVAVGWYVLTQADIDAGVVATSATVAGSDPLGQAASSSSSVSVPLASTPALKISSSGSFSGPVSVGAKVSWSFTVENTGNVTVSGVSIADQLASPGVIAYTWP